MSFDGAIRMFHQLLPEFVRGRFGLDAGIVGLYQMSMFVAFNQSSIWVAGALVFDPALFTAVGFEVLNLCGCVPVFLGVLASVGSQLMALRASVRVLAGIVGEGLQVIGRIRRLAGRIGYGHHHLHAQFVCFLELTTRVVAFVIQRRKGVGVQFFAGSFHHLAHGFGIVGVRHQIVHHHLTLCIHVGLDIVGYLGDVASG